GRAAGRARTIARRRVLVWSVARRAGWTGLPVVRAGSGSIEWSSPAGDPCAPLPAAPGPATPSTALSEAPSMIEALKSDAIVDKVGGKFKLCALLQKRGVQLMDGARPLGERNGRSALEVAIHEVLQEKNHVHPP